MLPLEELGVVSPLEGLGAGELTLPPATAGMGWPNCSSSLKLALVVWISNSQWADNLNYNPWPDLGF